jgi:hypothetical protein
LTARRLLLGVHSSCGKSRIGLKTPAHNCLPETIQDGGEGVLRDDAPRNGTTSTQPAPLVSSRIVLTFSLRFPKAYKASPSLTQHRHLFSAPSTLLSVLLHGPQQVDQSSLALARRQCAKAKACYWNHHPWHFYATLHSSPNHQAYKMQGPKSKDLERHIVQGRDG